MPERKLEVRRALDQHVLAALTINADDVPAVTFEELDPEAVGGPMQTWVISLAPGVPDEEAPGELVAEAPVGSPHIQLFVDRARAVRFRIVASNGEIVAASQAYSGRGGRRNARKTAERFGLPIVDA